MNTYKITYYMNGMLYEKTCMGDLYGVIGSCGVYMGDILKIEKVPMPS